MFGSYVKPPSSLNSTSPPTIAGIPPETLTDDFLEEIKTRMCLVTERPSELGVSLPSEPPEKGMSSDIAGEDNALLISMEERFAPKAMIPTISMRVPSLRRPPVSSGVGRGWIAVPGWIRERAADLLFEDGDEDEQSLTELVLDVLLKVSRRMPERSGLSGPSD